MSRRREYWVAFLRAAAVPAIFLWAESSAAKDETLGPEPEAAITPEPSAPAGTNAKFDLGLGGAVVTDYVSRGITQTDSGPAIQGYVEPSYSIAYVNIWSSNVDFGDDFRGAEIDVAGGIRPKFGPLSLNVGWVHYFFMPEDISPAYGEVFAKADYEVTDKFVIGTQIWFAPDFNQTGKANTFPVIGAKWVLTKNLSLYGGVGYQFFEDPKAFESSGLDCRSFLRLALRNVRRPLLGHGPFRQRVRHSKRVCRRMRRESGGNYFTRSHVVRT